MKRKSLWFLLIGYVVVLHCLVLWPDRPFLNRWQPSAGHHRMMSWYHRQVTPQVPPGAVLFIGDSITQALCVSAVTPRGVNLGTGADTTRDVLYRISDYQQAMQQASAVVLAIGTNDYMRHELDQTLGYYQQILEKIPPGPVVVLSSAFPVDERGQVKLQGRNVFIGKLNQALASMAQQQARLVYLDHTPTFADATGQLDPALHIGDGLHLSTAGYHRWAQNLHQTLHQVCPDPEAPAPQAE